MIIDKSSYPSNIQFINDTSMYGLNYKNIKRIPLTSDSDPPDIHYSCHIDLDPRQHY